MNRTGTNIFLIFLFLAFASPMLGQDTTRISVSANRNNILIGEPIIISLEADIPENEPIRFFRLDTLPHFDILDRGRIDTSNTGEGTLLRQQIRITSFDSGTWTIPPIPLGETIVSDSIIVEVGYTPFNPDQPYHDIKDIIEVAPKEEESTPWWWFAAGAALVLAIVFYLVFRGKKPAAAPPPLPPKDQYLEAMQALQHLAGSKLEGKLWFTRLVEIFRVYVDERKNIRSQQQTSDDLLAQLKSVQMSAPVFDRLAQALRLSDFVKFAKYQPTVDDQRQAITAVEDAINQMEGKN